MPQENDTIIILDKRKRFAWVPTLVEGESLWFKEYYKIMVNMNGTKYEIITVTKNTAIDMMIRYEFQDISKHRIYL